MQTILGSGGAIGIELAKALTAFTQEIRLVSRNPQKVNETDQLFPADVMDKTQLSKAIEGSAVVYVTVGFEYKYSVWKSMWVPFMMNVLDACEQHKAKLVFFDNMYALNKSSLANITEESPINPCSKKGAIRAEVNRLILKAIEEKKVDAIIARSPDFFGAEKKQNSMLMNLIYDNYKKGKAAQWFGNADAKHTMGYTPDLAKGTAILGNSLDAYNQIWNLPTVDVAYTGRQWAALFAKEMQVKNKIIQYPTWMLRLLGIFIPVLGEVYEMSYQFEVDYVFNSSKFKKRFDFTPTNNDEAVRQVVSAMP
ncbi:MAG: NAD-dependent epimerase/dehydratase family protein [Bacteroidetes bacterium]|nr:NAD-dependent epimerase/dehydratase family protein [Bacteroidota bacterium]MBP6314270.1 NAD-dependent epimerase/dehydratase family protein [Chitinophagaceae bacterium]